METETDTFWGSSAISSLGSTGGKRAAGPSRAPTAPARRTLLELAEPIFQYVCRLNRSAKKSAGQDPAHVRGDLKALFTDARAKAATDLAQAQQWKLAEPALIFFVDFMIRSSQLPFAMDWEDLAYTELNRETAGDEKFFDLLDKTLAERSDTADERIAIFYTCIGLGFTGFYTGQPEYLRKKMLECSSRIRGMIDADPSAKVCPDAYENVNTANLIESPGASLVGIFIALLGLTIVLFVANGYWYRNSAQLLGEKVKSISESVQSSPPRLSEPKSATPAHSSPTTVKPEGGQ